MRPVVLIIETRLEIAAALEAVIAAANLTTVVVPHLEQLSDLETPPAVILVRIAFESTSDPPHNAIRRLPPNRPPVVAIAWDPHELDEARRLECDVVLHAPHELFRLAETLASLIDPA